MTLVEIIKQNCLDTDKEIQHKYCSLFYDEAFKHLKDTATDILEIGCWHGGSLLLWNEYFSNANILGLDIEERNVKEVIAGLNRVNFIQSDAYDDANIQKLGQFDVIIDDGPHTFETQLKFVKEYSKKLKPGGILVVEDILSLPFCKEFEKVVPKNMKFETINLLQKSAKADNVLFVVRNI
jgi:SAM-dependent methyltransferase